MGVLKLATPFASLDAAQVRDIEAKMLHVTVSGGDDLIQQGASGDAAYFLLSGAMLVTQRRADGTERTLARLEPGAVIGEVALLTHAPRNATVRALEPSELLALTRDDLESVLRQNASVKGAFLELNRLRSRPRRMPDVTLHVVETSDGDEITVLKSESRHVYYRLSSRGRFIWDRLDGEVTIKDLTLAYHAEFQEFAPDTIVAMLVGLARAGFVDTAARGSWLDESASAAQRLAVRLRELAEWRMTWSDVDSTFARLYTAGGRFLFTRVAAAVLGVLSLVGLAVFALGLGQGVDSLVQFTPFVLLWLIPASLIATLLHELGHALATKHVGRVVRGAGIGWYWFGPIAFIDTTDTWLATRRQRILVVLAGPFVNLVLGGIAAIVSSATTGVVAAVALEVAVLNYTFVVVNFNPLLEYDGYHALTDWLDKPGLRTRSLRWLGSALPRLATQPGVLRGHGLELAFGAAALTYVAAMIGVTLWSFRAVMQSWIAPVVGQSGGTVLAWVAAFGIAVLALGGLWADLRAVRPGDANAG